MALPVDSCDTVAMASEIAARYVDEQRDTSQEVMVASRKRKAKEEAAGDRRASASGGATSSTADAPTQQLAATAATATPVAMQRLPKVGVPLQMRVNRAVALHLRAAAVEEAANAQTATANCSQLSALAFALESDDTGSVLQYSMPAFPRDLLSRAQANLTRTSAATPEAVAAVAAMKAEE